MSRKRTGIGKLLNRLKIKRLVSLLLIVIFCSYLGASYASVIPIPLTVSYLDVGQGDSILLQTKIHAILIDGGSREEIAVYKLQCLGVSKIDLLISTHPHENHIGGLIDIMEWFPVAEVIDSGFNATSKVYKDYLKFITSHHIKYSLGRDGDARVIDDVQMTILHPLDPLKGDMNENSIALTMTAGRINYLFMADAGLTTEHQILQRYPNLECTILKVGHHGSEGSTGKEFLYKVRPCEAVISVGKNTYGHPSQEVIKRLDMIGARLYRTDQKGTITIATDGSIYSIKTESANILEWIKVQGLEELEIDSDYFVEE